MHDDNTQIVACIPHLRRYARALAGDRAEADDLVQDTLERAWSKFTLWRRTSDVRAWLFSIMHNIHIDQVRRPKLATEALGDEALEVSVRAEQGDALAVRDIDAALRLLPDEQREIVLLVALEQLTYDEVAKTLRIPVGTVMSRLSRGREKLRAVMEGRAMVSPLRVVK
ncbi:MAG: RNA polymerase sigma factor [Gammaproteobacteria bacterium]